MKGQRLALHSLFCCRFLFLRFLCLKLVLELFGVRILLRPLLRHLLFLNSSLKARVHRLRKSRHHQKELIRLHTRQTRRVHCWIEKCEQVGIRLTNLIPNALDIVRRPFRLRIETVHRSFERVDLRRLRNDERTQIFDGFDHALKTRRRAHHLTQGDVAGGFAWFELAEELSPQKNKNKRATT